jgi:hypothetical protein
MSKYEYSGRQAESIFDIVKTLSLNDGLDNNAKIAELIKSVQTMKSQPDNELPINNFKSFNKLLAILHTALGVGFAVYFNDVNKHYSANGNFALDTKILRHTLELDIKEEPSVPPTNSDIVSKRVSKVVSEPSVKTIEALIIFYFFQTAAFHAHYANTASGNYDKMIRNKNNYLRWIEYAISSTLMLYIIALLSGVKDENIYASIYGINIAMIYTGQLVEEYADDEIKFMGKMVPKWVIPMTLGFVLLFVEFGIIIRNFNQNMDSLKAYIDKYSADEYSTAKLTSLNRAEVIRAKQYAVYLYYKDLFTIPGWIKYTVYGLFGFFASFGVISFQGVYKKEPYEKTEKKYLILSLLSKAFLGGFVAYGLGQRKKKAASVP